MRVVAGDAGGELVQVGEPDDRRAPTTQACDHLGVMLRDGAIERLAAAGERGAAHLHEVLDRDRHAHGAFGDPRESVQARIVARAPQCTGRVAFELDRPVAAIGRQRLQKCR